MAEVVISPLLQVILEKLASPVLAKLELGRSYRQELEKLKRTLPMIQAVIEDAEGKQWKDKKVRIWLQELKSLAYDADDLLDELTTRVLQRKLKKTKVKISCLSLRPLSKYYSMPLKLKSIQERLADLVNNMSSFQFKETVLLGRSQTLERRQTGPYVDESEVFGREKDVDTLVNFVLSSGSSGVNVSVLSVVGIGGIGKTTVAQLVYNDKTVEKNFDLRIWISVCHEFDVKKIMNQILDYAAERKCESKQLGVLQTHLRESLNGKRYLLVLDDVWNEDQDEWEKLQYPLRIGAQGSMIIVTTRSTKVASIASTIPRYTLKALNDDDCWALFMKRAFPEEEQDQYPNLQAIGKHIVRKCIGVPLAAKILGSLMRFQREGSEWSHVWESELWNLDEGENRILSALRLSYNHLPSQLKRCFAYCAVFPKNIEMTREKLIQLWIAEGLIQATRDTYSTKKMEDIGNEYFNEFLLMSLFQVTDKGEENMTDQFQMNNLLHDLAKWVAGREFLTAGEHHIRQIEFSPPELFEHDLSQVRHAALLCSFKSSSVPEGLCAAKSLGTLRLFSSGDESNKTMSTVVRKFKHLRVLDLSDSGIKRLSKSIGKLIHLRYIDLSHTFLETLPKTICHLCNLQTLNLTGCHNLKMLPEGMKSLINLRHLIINNCARLARMPPSMRNLLNLQTLSFYIVGPSFEESLFQLVHLDLRGELKLRRLENAVHIVPDLCLEQKQLRSLGLSWGDDDDETKWDDSSRLHSVDVDRGCDDEALLN